MIRRTFSLAVLVGLLSAPAFAQGQVFHSAEHNYRLVKVADSLVNPWSMAFLPNGDMLVTERAGQLRIVRNGQLLPDPVPGVPRDWLLSFCQRLSLYGVRRACQRSLWSYSEGHRGPGKAPSSWLPFKDLPSLNSL